MIETCEKALVQASARAAAMNAIPRRGQSGVRVRAISQTAWATTATAASFRPWTQPACDRSTEFARKPNVTSHHRWQGEPEPGREAASNTRPMGANGDPELTARWSGQRLAQRDEVRVRRLVQPGPPLDVLPMEVPKMRDRSAKRGQPQATGDLEDLEGRCSWVPGRRAAVGGRGRRLAHARAQAEPAPRRLTRDRTLRRWASTVPPEKKSAGGRG